MKSKAQKRREARERIERSIPALEAEIALVKSTLKSGSEDERQVELTRHYTALLRKLDYRRTEIQCIKAKEAGRGARKDPHPEIVR